MRDLVILAVVFGLVPFILYRAWFGALAWTWIGLMNPHQFAWGVATTFPVAAVIGGATLVALVLTRERKAPGGTAPMLALLLMAIFYTAKLPFGWAAEAGYEQWDRAMKILLMTFVITMLIHEEHRIKWLLWIIVLSLGFYGFKGGLFVIATGGQHQVQGPERSFLSGNTQLGVALIMVLPLIFAAARLAERNWVRLLCYATFWLTMLAIVFTYSRGAFLGLAIVFPFIFLRMRRKALVALMLVPAAAMFIALTPQKLFERAETIQDYEADHSAMQRLQAWSVAKNVALARPLTGGGFALDAIAPARWLGYADFMGAWNNRPRAAHSIYFQILGEHGFVGLLLYATALVGTLLTLSRVRRRADHLPGAEWMAEYARAIQIGLYGYMISGAFVSLGYFDLFYTYVAVTAIFSRELVQRGQPTRPEPLAARAHGAHTPLVVTPPP